MLPLAGVKEELDEGIVALHPRVAAADELGLTSAGQRRSRSVSR